MQTKEEQQLQITYYKNMEFFRDYNARLFHALTKAPTTYNLHIDSYGMNIIHIPTQTKHYPLIARDTNTKNCSTIDSDAKDSKITNLSTLDSIREKSAQDSKTMNLSNISPQTHTTSMQEAHSTLAQNPLQNPKWELFVNFSLQFQSHFIDETKLRTTGACCNALLHECLRLITESNNDNTESSAHNALSKQDSTCKQVARPKQDYMAGQNSMLEFPLLESTTLDPLLESCMPNDSMQNDTITYKDPATQYNAAFFQNLINSFEHEKFLPQTNIYGLMGGLFLQELLDSGYSFHSLLLYEDHIDLFRISLYFVDYALLFERVGTNACFIIIKDISFELVRAFLHAKKLTNNIVSLSLTHYTNPNVARLQECIMKEKRAIMRGWGSLEDELLGFYNACENLRACRLLTKNPKRVHAPICVIGNGASLDLCIDFLKAHKDSMILFSCGTALKVLRHHGIKPDFQIEIERVPYLWQVLEEAKLEDIPLLFAQTTNTKARDLSVESYAFLRGGSSSAYIDSGLPVLEFSAPFVGNAGVALAALLGSDVLLCGVDCGYIEGYSKHAKHSFYGNEGLEIPKDCFLVEGNADTKVYSNDIFYLSAKNIEESINLYKPNCVINLGLGMRFANTLALKPDDFFLQPIDKKREIQNLKANFAPYALQVDIDSMRAILEDFHVEVKTCLTKEIESIQDVFSITQNMLHLLQKYIDKPEKRKSIILLEGSITHITYTHLLTQLFLGNTKDSKKHRISLQKLYMLYIQGLDSLIQECKTAIIDKV